MRLDVYLVEMGYATSRDKAKELIARKYVLVNGIKQVKPATEVKESDRVEVDSSGVLPYVSRGGLKLEKAITDFGLDFNGRYVLDIGASTGGFTDCALQHGAAFVWAIDVGTNQLDPLLRGNPRVQSMENCDIRNLTPDDIGRKVDCIVADLSFISLGKIAECLPNFLSKSGWMVLLIKPQFEVGVKGVGTGGIVKDTKLHCSAIHQIVKEFSIFGLYLKSITHAPILYERKNIEYLGHFVCEHAPVPNFALTVKEAFSAQKQLKKS